MSSSLMESDAAYLRELLRLRSGIQFDASKDYLFDARLAQLANERGHRDIAGLVDRARTGCRATSTAIVEALTIHETLFFRDFKPFEALRVEVLPRLIRARAGAPIQVWSAACSSGQEPYSIAILARHHFPSTRVRVLATDLSRQVLDRAREGIFRQMEVNRGLPIAMLMRFFDQEGRDWRLKPEIRDSVEFRQLNLLDSWMLGVRPDVIFLRNVLIYFDLPTKREILAQAARVIAPDGVLFLGAAETTLNLDEQWERVPSEDYVHYRVRR